MTDSYVVFDLETTGINPNSDCIIEIGAIKVIENKVQEVYKTYVNPQMKVPHRITDLTGITDDMVSDGKRNKEAVEEFIHFCEGYTLLGHNIGFDYGFIKKSAISYKIPFNKMGIDTLKIARRTLSHIPRRNLEYLCEYYHIEQREKHRAYEDALSTKEVYDNLVNDFYRVHEELFSPEILLFKEKKNSPITKLQKVYLNDLLKYHKIELELDIDTLTKSEASKRIDYIILNYGRIKR